MATAFRRKGSRVVGRLDEQERGIVAGLLSSTRELLDPDADDSGDPEKDVDPLERLRRELDAPTATPEEVEQRDPALRRLLPPASRDDEDLARDFRALTEDSLRRRKVATITAAIAALDGATSDKVELDLGQAQALMMALSDVRLVLGERLGLRTDEDSARLEQVVAAADDFEDPAVMAAVIYDLLTWLQESVAQALLR